MFIYCCRRPSLLKFSIERVYVFWKTALSYPTAIVLVCSKSLISSPNPISCLPKKCSSNIYLALHIHNDRRTGAVTHNKLLHVFWDGMHRIDSDIRCYATDRWLKRVNTFSCFDIPNLGDWLGEKKIVLIKLNRS